MPNNLSNFSSSNTQKWLIGLVPIFPPLYLLGLPALSLWRDLPSYLKNILLLFLGLQTLSGVFTLEPLLSVPLALLRGLFIIAMVCLGVYLARAHSLRPLLWGELATIVIAVVSTIIRQGGQFWNFRLEHPLYWPVSLGLSSAIAFLFGFVRDDLPRWLRVSILALAICGMLLSGSRAGQVAAICGALVICLMLKHFKYWRRFALSILIGVSLSLLFANLAPVIKSTGQNPIGRSVGLGLDLTGRTEVWTQAWTAFLAHPVGGVGTYQIGPYIPALLLPCKLFPPVEPFGPCPPALERLNGAWNIAHNFLLHGLTETGIIGALGWIILLFGLGFLAWRSQEPLLMGLWVAYMVVNMVDNSTLVPSPHYAEVFYVAMGVAAAKALSLGRQTSELTTGEVKVKLET